MINTKKWKSLQPIQWPRDPNDETQINAPILIGSSFWIVSKTGPLSGGTYPRYFIEYNIDSDSIVSTIPYPRFFENTRCKSCAYNEDSVVLFNECGIVVFDTNTRSFGELTPLPNTRDDASCVVIGNDIHIINAFLNHEGRYLIYSVTDRTVNTFEEPLPFTTGQAPIIKANDSYKSSNKMLISGFARKQNGGNIPSVIVDLVSKFSIFELFQFGGFKYRIAGKSRLCANDSFYVGSLQNIGGTNGAQRIQWALAPEYKMKYPLTAFGHIQYGPFIVTFGGVSDDRFREGTVIFNTDHIYILDLRKKYGWTQCPVKCPKKAYFHAVLDEDQRVHLWGRYGCSKLQPARFRSKAVWEHEHYCINLMDIIPQLMKK